MSLKWAKSLFTVGASISTLVWHERTGPDAAQVRRPFAWDGGVLARHVAHGRGETDPARVARPRTVCKLLLVKKCRGLELLRCLVA